MIEFPCLFFCFFVYYHISFFCVQDYVDFTVFIRIQSIFSLFFIFKFPLQQSCTGKSIGSCPCLKVLCKFYFLNLFCFYLVIAPPIPLNFKSVCRYSNFNLAFTKAIPIIKPENTMDTAIMQITALL